jgi:glycolate oxidase
MSNTNVIETLADELTASLGAASVLTDLAARRSYDCDGLTQYRVTPALVVLATDAAAIQTAVTACARHGVPWVARGSGTGLSGGATPLGDGVVIVTSQLRHILEIDPDNQRAVVEPGVINLDVTRAAEPFGLYYAPDPSSQQVCSIGGNLAENSGGAHCLKYGFTTNHVTGLSLVLPSGEAVDLGGKAPEYPGYDLVGTFVGSEGTLGIATAVTLRLLRAPETVQTVLAGFNSIDAAAETVTAIIGGGVLPAAIEMMDALAIEAAEAATSCGYPSGAVAVLIIELDGPAAEVAAGLAAVTGFCEANGAFEVRVAASADERALIWRGRKSAFAAVGRISPNFYVQDGVIPRTALPAVLLGIKALADTAGVRVANVFHAGDGNLHPLILFDDAVPGQAEKAHGVAEAILSLCLAQGGSITGEHGVGLDKKGSMAAMFSAVDMDVMQYVRCSFDSTGLANPGKLFPTPRLCGEAPGPRSGVHPLVAAGLADSL